MLKRRRVRNLQLGFLPDGRAIYSTECFCLLLRSRYEGSLSYIVHFVQPMNNKMKMFLSPFAYIHFQCRSYIRHVQPISFSSISYINQVNGRQKPEYSSLDTFYSHVPYCLLHPRFPPPCLYGGGNFQLPQTPSCAS